MHLCPEPFNGKTAQITKSKSRVPFLPPDNDFATTFAYDKLDRMTRIQQTNQTGGNAVAPKRIDLAYDAASRPESITRYANLAGTQLVATREGGKGDATLITYRLVEF